MFVYPSVYFLSSFEDYYETLFDVILPHGYVHTVWSFFLDKNSRNDGCRTKRISGKLGLIRFPQLVHNNLQDCYETLWSDRLLYGDVHIIKNLCLDKHC